MGSLKLAIGVAVAGAIGWAISVAVAPGRAILGYLAAYVWAVSIAVGALILLMVGYAVNARWMSVIRRITDSLALATVPLAVLFAPIAVWSRDLYIWVDPPSDLPAHVAELLRHKSAYLRLDAFVARAALYFAVWIGAAALLRAWSRRRDGRVDQPPVDAVTALGRERALSCAGLPAVGLALTFASFDWVMSLEPEWASTMYGVYLFAGGFVAAIGAVALIAERAVAAGATGGAITPHHFHALGRLLLAFTVFWTYVAFFQAFLIAIADRPEEITFYLARTAGGWKLAVWALIAGHFVLPLLLLLPRQAKFSPRRVGAIGAWMCAMHYVDMMWLVIPAGGGGPHVADLAALAAIGGAVAAFVLWQSRRVGVIARADPMLPAGAVYQVAPQ